MSAEQTPDLSKIVGIIMEHPELIEQISKLASGTSEKSETAQSEELPAAKEEEIVSVSEPASTRVHSSNSKRRTQLLYALKPYLSEKRSHAIDSMLTFGEIFDMMKQGKER